MMELEKTLLLMGARPHRRGYLQTVELLRIFRDKPNISSLYDAYQEVGTNLEATPQQLDRNLRDMIREIWDYGNRELLLKFMPWCRKNGPPSNKDFLCTFGALLRTGALQEFVASPPSTSLKPKD